MALVAACATGLYMGFSHPIRVAAAADLVATVVVFGASYLLRNSSMYDPYWSVAPPLLAVYWAIRAEPPIVGARQLFVLLLVTAWAVRLTYNCFERWHSLEHEDWRYEDLKAQTGGAYWLVSFAGIHLFPTIVVFLGCLPVYVAISKGYHPFGWLDLVATIVTGAALWIEWSADNELRAFLASEDRKPEDYLQRGLWARSRHPNYFGEMTFWWGLYLFGLAAAPQYWWWTALGAICITLMFVFISVPMIDKRMLAKRPAYAEHMQRTNALLLWPSKQ